MADSLNAIDASLTGEEQPPIIGLAVIAPFDTANRLASKGTRIAVVPTYGDSEDTGEETITDNERDFRGEE